MNVFLAVQLVKSEEMLQKISTIFTHEGLDLYDLFKNTPIWNYYNTYKEMANPSQSVQSICTQIIKDLNVSASIEDIKHDVSKIFDRKSTLKDILPPEYIDSLPFPQLKNYTPYISRAAQLLNFDKKKAEEIMNDLTELKFTKTLQNYADFLELPVEYIFEIADFGYHFFNDENYPLKEIPKHFQMNSTLVMKFIENIQTYLKDDKINSEAASLEFKDLMITISGIWKGFRILARKTLFLGFSILNKVLPKSSKDAKSLVDGVIEIYDDMVRDDKFSESEKEQIQSFDIEELRKFSSARGGRFDVFKLDYHIQALLGEEISLFGFYIERFIGLPLDFINRIKNFMKSFPNNVDVNKFLLDIFPEPEIKAHVFEFLKNFNNPEFLLFEFDTTEIIRFLNGSEYSESLHSFISAFNFIDSDAFLQSILYEIGIGEPYWPDIKKALVNVADGLMELNISFLKGPKKIISNVLRNISNIIGEDARMGDIIKCIPYGEIYVDFNRFVKNIKPDMFVNRPFENTVNGRRLNEVLVSPIIENALKGKEVLGCNILETIKNLAEIKIGNLINVANAIVIDHDGLAKSFVNGFKQLADDLSKGKKVPVKDAISILGIDANYVYDSAHVLEFATWPVNDAIKFISGMNVSQFTKKFYKLTLSDQVSFIDIGEFGKVVEKVIVENPDVDPNIEDNNNDDNDKNKDDDDKNNDDDDDKNKDDDDDKNNNNDDDKNNNNDDGQTQPKENIKKPLSKGKIALIVVGAILGIVVIAVCILVVVIRIKNKNAKAENTTAMALII